jgi:hypothetical protein
MAPRTIWRRKARASAIFLCCTSRRLAGSFTEEVTWDVENRKTPPFLRVRLEIRLDEDLDGLLAGVYFEADRCIAEIHFMSATALSTNYGMRHLLFRSGWKFLAIGPDNKLYLNVGPPCNICLPSPAHAQLRRIHLDGSAPEVVAYGVLQVVGMDWHPVLRQLYFTENSHDPTAPASQSGLQRLTCECGSKQPGTAPFRGSGLVSVCGVWARNAHSGSLSPRAIFGVSFSYGAPASQAGHH